MRINVFIEVIGAKQTLSARGYFDVITRAAACYSVDWVFEAVQVKVTADIDVNECNLGLLGIFLGTAVDCSWKNNYLGYTFYDLNPLNGKFDLSGSILETTCQVV